MKMCKFLTMFVASLQFCLRPAKHKRSLLDHCMDIFEPLYALNFQNQNFIEFEIRADKYAQYIVQAGGYR
jgi:hypothetical protein